MVSLFEVQALVTCPPQEKEEAESFKYTPSYQVTIRFPSLTFTLEFSSSSNDIKYLVCTVLYTYDTKTTAIGFKTEIIQSHVSVKANFKIFTMIILNGVPQGK